MLSAHAEVAAQLVNAVVAEHPELQPTPAAEALGVLQQPSARRTAADLSAEAAAAGTRVLELCWRQVQDHDAWVAHLSPEAAAAALFATWFWATCSAADLGAVSVQQPAGEGLALLRMDLYYGAKLSGDSLVFELGLLAAAKAPPLTGDMTKGGSVGLARPRAVGALTGA
jgi:hypothetical protein